MAKTTPDYSRTQTPAQIKKLVEAASIKARRPSYIWGPPGIGKSEVVAALAKEHKSPVIDLRMALLDPTDLRGIGFYNPNSNTMDWAAPVDLPTKEYASQFEHVVLFLDEMNSAPPAVQSAAYQLVLDRKIGQYELPDNTVIIAAGNRETDRGVTYRMPAPLANRFVHFEMTVDHKEWEDWAIEHSVHSEVVGYLHEHKQDLFDFKPNTSGRSFATPRSWVFVSEILKEDLGDREIEDIISGTVGEGMCSKFNGFRKWTGKLPTASDVIDGKVKDLKVDEISARFTLMLNLCYELTERLNHKEKKADDEWQKWVDTMLGYIMQHMNPELVIMGMRTAVLTYKLPIKTKALKNWNAFNDEYGKYILSHVE